MAAFEEKPIWSALYESVRDAFFPPHLPPLELTSRPIPVPDRMAAGTNPWAVGSSTAVNGAILAIVILLGMRAINPHGQSPLGPHVDISHMQFFAPFHPKPSNGGNGGGTHDLIDPIEGRNPRLENTPITPPMVPLIEHPKLEEDPAIAVNILPPDNPSMPSIGVHNSTNVTLDSNGPGGPHGIGTGTHGDYGPGNGPGSGPGDGNSIYSPGHGVTAPVLVSAPSAEFSDEARRNKYQGVCLVSVVVDARGVPQNLHVTRALGMGLDEKAMEAIRRYRFKPGTKDGKPVAVQITVEVDFRLF
jgi:periplasmic protein TonB